MAKQSKVTKSPAAGPQENDPVIPWVRYERFTVEEIVERCAIGGKALRRRVLAYEQAHGKRAGVLAACNDVKVKK